MCRYSVDVCHIYVLLTVQFRSWCGPCKMLSPILTKIAGEDATRTGSGQHIDLVTIDTDEHGELAQKYGVRNVLKSFRCVCLLVICIGSGVTDGGCFQRWGAYKSVCGCVARGQSAGVLEGPMIRCGRRAMTRLRTSSFDSDFCQVEFLLYNTRRQPS